MTFDDVTFVGPPIVGPALVPELPVALSALLRETNGFIAGDGAIHVRGLCDHPAWHSLMHAWTGAGAFAAHYRSVRDTDIPFAQDALGDQYLLRDGAVLVLSAESDDIAPFADSLRDFLVGIANDPVEYLALGPLVAFWDGGGLLAPGQLLSVYPPLVVTPDAGGYSYRAVSAADLHGAHASFAASIRDLPDGQPITLRVRDRTD